MPQRPVLSGGPSGGRLLGSSSQFDRARSTPTSSVDQTAEIAAKGQAAVGNILADFGKDLFNFALTSEKNRQVKEANTLEGNKRLLNAQVAAELATMEAQGEITINQGKDFDFEQATSQVLDGFGLQLQSTDDPNMVQAWYELRQEMDPIFQQEGKKHNIVYGEQLKSVRLTKNVNKGQAQLEDSLAKGDVQGALTSLNTLDILYRAEGTNPELKKTGLAYVRQMSKQAILDAITISDKLIKDKVEKDVISGLIKTEEDFKAEYMALSAIRVGVLNSAIADTEDQRGFGYYMDKKELADIDLTIKDQFVNVTDTEIREMFGAYKDTRTAKIINLRDDLYNQYKTAFSTSGSTDLDKMVVVADQYIATVNAMTEEGVAGPEALSMVAEATANREVLAASSQALSELQSDVFAANPYQLVQGSEQYKLLQEELQALRDQKAPKTAEQLARMKGLETGIAYINDYLTKTSAYDIAVDATGLEANGVKANATAFKQGKQLKPNRELDPVFSSAAKSLPYADAPQAYRIVQQVAQSINTQYEKHEGQIPKTSFFGDMYTGLISRLGDNYSPQQQALLKSAFEYSGNQQKFELLFTVAQNDLFSKNLVDKTSTKGQILANISIMAAKDEEVQLIQQAMNQNNPFLAGFQTESTMDFVSKLALVLAEGKENVRLAPGPSDKKLSVINMVDNSTVEMGDYFKQAKDLLLNGRIAVTTGKSTVLAKLPSPDWQPEQYEAALKFLEDNKSDWKVLEQLGLNKNQFPEGFSMANVQITNANGDDEGGIVFAVPKVGGGLETVGHYPGLKAKVLQVIDGDTIKIEGSKASIRLSDINAPESSQPEGAEATELLKSLVGENGEIDLVFKGVDNYNRPIARIRNKAGEDVNLVMVREGPTIAFMTADEAILSAHNKNLAEGRYDGMADPQSVRGTTPKAVEEAIAQDTKSTQIRLYFSNREVLEKFGTLSSRTEFVKKLSPRIRSSRRRSEFNVN